MQKSSEPSIDSSYIMNYNKSGLRSSELNFNALPHSRPPCGAHPDEKKEEEKENEVGHLKLSGLSPLRVFA